MRIELYVDLSLCKYKSCDRELCIVKYNSTRDTYTAKCYIYSQKNAKDYFILHLLVTLVIIFKNTHADKEQSGSREKEIKRWICRLHFLLQEKYMLIFLFNDILDTSWILLVLDGYILHLLVRVILWEIALMKEYV